MCATRFQDCTWVGALCKFEILVKPLDDLTEDNRVDESICSRCQQWK